MRNSIGLALPVTLSLFSILTTNFPHVVIAAESKAPHPSSTTPKHTELELPTTGTLGIEVVQTPTNQRKHQITEQARKFFRARDFEALDKFGNELCKDKSIQENGCGWSDTFISAIDDMVTNEMPDSRWDEHLKRISDWAEQKPQSVLPQTAMLATLTSYAWKARGSGWANTVTDEGWRLFNERLERAAHLMTEAEALPQTCPTLYKEELKIALGQSWKHDRMNKAFNKCVKLFPDYMSIYISKYIFLMPRWGGAEGEAEEFLDESANKRGKGPEGDKFYARLLWNMGNYFDTKTFTDTTISWPRAKAGFEALMKEYPDSLSVLTEYAKVAEYADDKATSRALLKKIGNRCDAGIWSYQGAWAKWYFNKFREHVLSNKKSSDPDSKDE